MNSQNNFNVLCSIGSSLVTNTQLNSFPNASTFGVGSNVATTNLGNSNAGGSVTIYTTTTTTAPNDQQNVGEPSAGEVSGSVGITGGPLQEIIVNPTSMVGWRLSANGSLIPPPDILTSGLPTAAAQKRGSERLFQYLEADGSDPEDYARLLKMDAISRNTASVAQDFHKAGGVQELKIPANHQLLFNNRLLTQQWTAKEAAALLASLSNNKNAQESQNYLNQLIQQQQQQQQQLQQQQQKQQGKQQNIRKRNHSTGEEDENTPSSASSTTSNDGEMSSAVSTTSSSMGSNASIDQRKAMLKFLSNNFNLKENKLKNEINYNNNNNNINNKHNINQVYMNENQENQEQLIESPPASSLKYKNNNNNNLQKHKIFHDNNNNNSNNNKKFRLDLYKDNKENTVVSATIDPNNMTNAAAQVAANYLTALEYQNMNSHKIGTQLENYIKEIINKYYITNDIQTNMLCYAQQQQQQQQQQRIDEEEIEEEHEQEQTKRKRILSETEGYIEYLKNKSDITLTITPKLPAATTISTVPPTKRHHQQQSHHRQAVEIIPTTSSKQLKNNKNNNHNNNNNQQHKNQMNNKKKSIGQIATLLPLLADAASKQQYLATPLDFSQKPLTTLTTLNDETTITTIPKSIPSSPTTITKITNTATIATTTDNIVINNSNSKKRKQAQPKKKGRPSPQVILARLRDKYLNRLVKRKLKCLICAQKRHNSQMVFNYHSKATLTLHRLWKHPKKLIQKTFPHQ